MLFRRINLLWFIASFAVGLLVCYVITPPPNVVVKFPSPYNAGSIVYKDGADNCFTYQADKVTCPKDTSLIKNQPIFENFYGQ